VEYLSPGGRRHTAAITNTGSGQPRTATWTIGDALMVGAFAAGADFRIFDLGPGDLEVLFVRLVKLDPPQTTRARTRRAGGRVGP
jgi:hypothetical protein